MSPLIDVVFAFVCRFLVPDLPCAFECHNLSRFSKLVWNLRKWFASVWCYCIGVVRFIESLTHKLIDAEDGRFMTVGIQKMHQEGE